jgi:NDP-sugar pyrophosphorylase family protein
MKAMLLAAGLGERMRPLTLLRAKPALPVLNRPLLHWTLERLAKAGVSDVVVNLHHLAETVRAAIGDGHRFGLNVRYSREPRILGRGGALRKVRRWLGNEPVLVVNGDVWFDFDLRALIERHLRSGARVTLGLWRNPDPRRYTPVFTDRSGRVVRIGRWRARGLHARSGAPALFAGIHVVDPALLERLPSGQSDSVRDLYVPMLEAGEAVHGLRLAGAWYDLGHPGAYLASQIALLRRDRQRRRRPAAPGTRIQPTARVTSSVVGPGCAIGAGARVSGSVLWDGVTVGAGSSVVRSILASGVVVPAGESWSGTIASIAGGRLVRTDLEGE